MKRHIFLLLISPKILYYFECFQRVFHANGSKIPIYQFRTLGTVARFQFTFGHKGRFKFTNSTYWGRQQDFNLPTPHNQGRQRDFNLPSDTRGRYKISIYQLRILWTLARFQFTTGRQQDIYRRTLARFQFTTGYYQVGKLKSLQYPKLVN